MFPWVVVCLLVELGRAELSCKDMNNKDVDWFIALKTPIIDNKEYAEKSPFIKSGTAFFYADANNQEFQLSPTNINDPRSAIGYTMVQAINAFKKNAKDVFSMFYNDQHPDNRTLGNRAHSKGVLAVNKHQGFWVLHSAPRFVDLTDGIYSYPPTGMKYGQSFFCGTFGSDQYDEIAIQMIVAQFSVYESSPIPPELREKHPRLEDVATEKKVGWNCKKFRNTALKTKGGQWLRSYEKDARYLTDIYAEQVVSSRKLGMFVETWLNGQNPDWKNTCGANGVQNLKSISPGGVTWASSKDHSKWAVTKEPAMVCIGDVNRQESQSRRGGGTMCIENQKIWKFFRDAVKTVECCPNDKECEAPPDDSVDVPTGLDPFGGEN